MLSYKKKMVDWETWLSSLIKQRPEREKGTHTHIDKDCLSSVHKRLMGMMMMNTCNNLMNGEWHYGNKRLEIRVTEQEKLEFLPGILFVPS